MVMCTLSWSVTASDRLALVASTLLVTESDPLTSKKLQKLNTFIKSYVATLSLVSLDRCAGVTGRAGQGGGDSCHLANCNKAT